MWLKHLNFRIFKNKTKQIEINYILTKDLIFYLLFSFLTQNEI